MLGEAESENQRSEAGSRKLGIREEKIGKRKGEPRMDVNGHGFKKNGIFGFKGHLLSLS